MTDTPDAERVASIREAIRAANGDWHDITALWSVQGDLDWLLAWAEARLAATTGAAPSEAGR